MITLFSLGLLCLAPSGALLLALTQQRVGPNSIAGSAAAQANMLHDLPATQPATLIKGNFAGGSKPFTIYKKRSVYSLYEQ